MTDFIFDTPQSFLSKKRKNNLPVLLLKCDEYEAWLASLEKDVQLRAQQEGFSPKGDRNAFILYKVDGDVKEAVLLIGNSFHLYDAASRANTLRGTLSKEIVETYSFSLIINGKFSSLTKHEVEQALIGFALSNYAFDAYKTDENKRPILSFVWPGEKDADRTYIDAYTQSAFILRNLVNVPANDLGPDDIEDAASKIAKTHKASIKVVKGSKLEKDFPLIHTVGKASPRAPRLIEITWGSSKNPALVLVGKGVVFDTGGLDIKPSQYMRLMKKDMGGAAHALGLAQMVMALELPVSLRVLIPCVENAVGGAAFRPGDVIKSRKGITVENTNTDAEGRLILADSLTYASEVDGKSKNKPDLIIDFATLTGSARAALGPDIPAMFSNSDDAAQDLQQFSMDENDPLWRMPLWAAYNKTIESSVGDIVNSAGVPGDLIYSALFLQKFLMEDKNNQTPDWIHLDLFSWDSNGRPGRAKGGTDMGLRALYAYLKKRYAK